MPNALFKNDEFKGLSYSKVVQILLNSGFRTWASMGELVKGPARAVYRSLPNGRQVLVSGDPSPSNPCNSDDPVGRGYACEGQYIPGEQIIHWGIGEGTEYQHVADSLMGLLPVGMNGIELTDGANFIVFGRLPGSDVIAFSRSWFHSVDTGMGQRLGEMLVKGILSAVSGGFTTIVMRVVDQVTPSGPPAKPINLEVPDEIRENLLPGNPAPDDVPDLDDNPVIFNPPIDTTIPTPETPKSHTGLLLLVGLFASFIF